MTVQELNSYIKHYLEKDRTRTAIMLTGEWGSGKTYYIENELIPFLQDDKNNKCVAISLYGLESVSDISKSIYMELRMKAMTKSTESFATGKLITKTIVKGVTGIFGIDASVSEDDLQNIYSSIDLSGKLLVFEDMERSKIEITTLLGYINNLVERDGVKVLIVANQNEIINKSPEKFDFNFTYIRQPSQEDNEKVNKVQEEVQKYLRIKEKTISDTIYFNVDYCEAVDNIIKSFDNQKLQSVIDDDSIDEIVSIVKGSCRRNLRTLIFATQKTVDIIDRIDLNYECGFLKCIYFGMIYFSAKIKAGNFPTWEGTKYISTILGDKRYPLFKFCYDYIRWQQLDSDEILETKNQYNKMKLYDKNADRGDDDLQNLYYYYEKTESEVRNTLISIEKRLKNADDIGFYSYGKLAAYLVRIKHVIGFDYTGCMKSMIENIRGKGDDIDSDLLFLPLYEFNEIEKEEFDNFVEQLSDSMNLRGKNEFLYRPENIKNLYDYVIEESYKISNAHEFISRYDSNRIVEMIFHASARQIDDFRGVLFAVYRYANKENFIVEDRNTMETLLEQIQEKRRDPNCELDKIQLLQIDYLCENLKTFITQMS